MALAEVISPKVLEPTVAPFPTGALRLTMLKNVVGIRAKLNNHTLAKMGGLLSGSLFFAYHSLGNSPEMHR